MIDLCQKESMTVRSETDGVFNARFQLQKQGGFARLTTKKVELLWPEYRADYKVDSLIRGGVVTSDDRWNDYPFLLRCQIVLLKTLWRKAPVGAVE